MTEHTNTSLYRTPTLYSCMSVIHVLSVPVWKSHLSLAAALPVSDCVTSSHTDPLHPPLLIYGMWILPLLSKWDRVSVSCGEVILESGVDSTWCCVRTMRAELREFALLDFCRANMKYWRICKSPNKTVEVSWSSKLLYAKSLCR